MVRYHKTDPTCAAPWPEVEMIYFFAILIGNNCLNNWIQNKFVLLIVDKDLG